MGKFPDAKILDIDLTHSKIRILNLPGEVYNLYPGGSSLGVYLMLSAEGVSPDMDPLSPENPLVFSVSALTGLPISGLSRVVVTSKSPLTGTIGDSQAGGFFPAHLKGNGYDAVVLRGKAPSPVYLYIDEENIDIRSAQFLWGKTTGEAEELIRKDLNEEKIEIAQIGPGGENLVKYACIINMCNRANGRNGMGAVMGSKNLKAVVVKKQKAQKPYDTERFNNLRGDIAARLKDNEFTSGLGEFGTDGDLEGFSEIGFLPTKNWTSGYFPEGAKDITGATMANTILKKRDTCFSCAVRCKRVVEVPGEVDPLYGGPEYETAATFGSYCGVSNLVSISKANQLCNMYGIDTISCGATIAFAMECFERGLISKSDTNGLELVFGNDDAMLKSIPLIAKREGFGNILAEGSKRAAELISEKAIPLSITVKNQELPAHMPQYKPSVGIIYAVNPFGADHQSSEHDPFLVMPEDSFVQKRLGELGLCKVYDSSNILDEGKVKFAFKTQCYFSVLDTLCLCQFVWGPAWELYGPLELLELCKSGLGWDTSIDELMTIGERRINMMRYYNGKMGFGRKDDKLPDRLFEHMGKGPSEGVFLDKKAFEDSVELYYHYAGWDTKTGNPSDEKIRSLSLDWMIKENI